MTARCIGNTSGFQCGAAVATVGATVAGASRTRLIAAVAFGINQNGQIIGMKMMPRTQKIRFSGTPTLMKSMNR